MNKCILMGNLGDDPELRTTQGGESVMNLRMATTTRFKDRDGEWKERTDWHSVVVWGKRAEALGKFLRKGSKLLVEGELQTRSWEDKEGNKRYKTEVNAREVELLDRRKQEDEPKPAAQGGGWGDDDIPFG